MAQEIRTIKTYMSFGLPVDPSNVKTLVDLDLSYALASTLVDWTDNRNLRNGLAKAISSKSESEIEFQLRPEAKWSDGTPITAVQVVRSFERAKKLHAEDLKSLFEIISRIESRDKSTIVFHLNRSVGSTQILHKLTEPMYGIVFVRENGVADLSKTSGAFVLKSESAEELTLMANKNWYGREKNMADVVTIRQPKKEIGNSDQDTFSGDSWPNIIAASSLIPKEVANLYESNQFSVWNRSLDRVFFLSPSSRLANSDGRKFFRILNEKLDRNVLLRGLAGYHLSQQFFPPGYVVHDPEFQIKNSSDDMPAQFRQKSLEILLPDGRIGATLKNNLSEILKALTSNKPKFKVVPLADFEKERASGQYDILVATLPVNDPNVEGAVSFFFGMTPPLIPNSDDGVGDFRKRIATARSFEEKKRNIEYRKVFTQSVQDGCLLPLFHFSSVVVARNGIDLSRVPTSDETVAFSKIRFK